MFLILIFLYLIAVMVPSVCDNVQDLASLDVGLENLSSLIEPAVKKSPLITHSAWGKTSVEGFGDFEDVTLWPGGAKAWNFKRKFCPIMEAAFAEQLKTGHYFWAKEKEKAGIMPFEIRRLAKKGAKYIIISRGMGEKPGVGEPQLEQATSLDEYLRIKKLPKDLVESWNLGIDPKNIIFMRTQDAVKKYNELVEQGKPVGAIIHATC